MSENVQICLVALRIFFTVCLNCDPNKVLTLHLIEMSLNLTLLLIYRGLLPLFFPPSRNNIFVEEIGFCVLQNFFTFWTLPIVFLWYLVQSSVCLIFELSYFETSTVGRNLHFGVRHFGALDAEK